jgi:hypothetical protein
MNRKIDKTAGDEISRLVQEDEVRALEVFRRRDFRRRLKDRIGELSGKGERSVPSWIWSVSFGLGAVLLVAAWVLLLRGPSPGPDIGGSRGSFVAGLRSLPGLAELASRPGASEPGVKETPAVREPIWEALVRAHQSAAGDVESEPPRGGSLKVRRLSLERKMEILFKDKVIEQVLNGLQKKSEEV